MTSFGTIECTAIAAWTSFTFFQLSGIAGHSIRKRYNDRKPTWAPPAWVFPMVWSLLYAACTIAMYIFTKDVAAADSWQLIVGVIMYVVHIIGNKMWSVLFWDFDHPEAAANVLITVMIPTGATLLIAIVLSPGGLFWVPIMLWGLYLVWLCYATLLNVYWVQERLK